MASEDRVRWDTIFRDRAKQPYPAPDPILLEQIAPVLDTDPAPRALDLAAGLGQNGIWLAEQGYQVDIMDISRVALERARQEMIVRNLRNINLLPIDIDSLELEQNAYNVVCVFRYLKRSTFSLLKLATRRGGRIIYETFNTRYLEQVPQFNKTFLLQDGELRRIFSDWDITLHEEDTHISRIVATKL